MLRKSARQHLHNPPGPIPPQALVQAARAEAQIGAAAGATTTAGTMPIGKRIGALGNGAMPKAKAAKDGKVAKANIIRTSYWLVQSTVANCT